MKNGIRWVTPPIILHWAQHLRSTPAHEHDTNNRAEEVAEWEYVPEGWSAAHSDPRIKGWNVDSILNVYRAKWPVFVKQLEGTGPFGLAHESDLSTRTDPIYHNILMSYAYALSLSSRLKNEISLLDWGGGIGHYYLISRALMPDLRIDYHCKDVPLLAEYGQKLFPQAHFYSDEDCLKRKYDFVLASTSLHYSRDWKAVLRKLIGAASTHVFITQLPIIHRADSFVMLQRPYRHGYDTEYLGWCLNREEFLREAAESGGKLIREFVTGLEVKIQGAPEVSEFRGFLFQVHEA